MIDGLPVIDAVIHAYNFSPENYANRFAAPIADLTFHSVTGTGTPGYVMTAQQFYRDCHMEDLANLVFTETDTDLAVYHVLPIAAFHDGVCRDRKSVV